MNDQARGLILWILGAVGTMFIYCAYKNVTPASLVASMVNKTTPLKPIDPNANTPAQAADTLPKNGPFNPFNLPTTSGYVDNTPPTGAMMNA